MPPSFGSAHEDVWVAGDPQPAPAAETSWFSPAAETTAIPGPAEDGPYAADATQVDAIPVTPEPGGLPPIGPPPGDAPVEQEPSGRRGPQRAIKIAAVVAAFAVVTGGGLGAWAMTSGGGKSATADMSNAPMRPAAQAPTLTPDQIKAQQEQRRKQMTDQASRDARNESLTGAFISKGSPPKPKSTSSTSGNSSNNGTPPEAGTPVPAGTAQQIALRMLPQFGFSSGQFGCLVNLWERESGWNVHATNPYSGAYGLPQALPPGKMASAGPDYLNNASTQIKWGLGYIRDRWSTPCGAWANSQAYGWY